MEHPRSEPVECRSDGDFAGRPLAIYWQGERLVVDKILASWRTPGKKCFRVTTLDEKAFECCYFEDKDTWTVIDI